MKPNIKDIALIEDYLLGKLSKSAGKKLETRMASDPGLSSYAEEMRLTIAAIQKVGRNDFKKHMANIKSNNESQFKSYRPGGKSGRGIAGKTFIAFILIAGVYIAYHFLFPTVISEDKHSTPITPDSIPVENTTSKPTTFIERKPVTTEVETVITRRVKIIHRYREVDTIIKPGQEFDEERFNRKIQTDSVAPEEWKLMIEDHRE